MKKILVLNGEADRLLWLICSSGLSEFEFKVIVNPVDYQEENPKLEDFSLAMFDWTFPDYEKTIEQMQSQNPHLPILIFSNIAADLHEPGVRQLIDERRIFYKDIAAVECREDFFHYLGTIKVGI